MPRLLLPLLTLLALPAPAAASYGDSDPHYQACRASCGDACGSHRHTRWSAASGFNASYVEQLYAVAARADSASARTAPPPAREPLGVAERLLGWSCAEDCGHKCMEAAVKHWQATGFFYDASLGLDPIQQYHGKWPFRRVLGTQEIASTAFSIANAAPHAWYLFVVPRAAFRCPTGEAHYGSIWRLWAPLSLTTWLSSTVFHARDTWVTERLDYHFATAYLVYIAFALAVDLLPRGSARRALGGARRVQDPAAAVAAAVGGAGRKVGHEGESGYGDGSGAVDGGGGVSTGAAVVVGCIAVLFWLGHCAYLNFVRFDYGYNMGVSVALYFVSFFLFLFRWGRDVCCCRGKGGEEGVLLEGAQVSNSGSKDTGSSSSSSSSSSTGAEDGTGVAGVARPTMQRKQIGRRGRNRRRTRTHMRQGLVSLLGTAAAAGMELGDFPPLWKVFDAHSLWHACTPPLTWLLYRCVLAECEWRRDDAEAAKKEEAKTE